MKAASISELKQELQNISAKEITDICLRLARFKKENKELLRLYGSCESYNGRSL